MNGARQNLQINDAMRTDIANSVLCWLATVDADGTPNVTPKKIFSSFGDDRIVVADIAFSNTVRNIRAHPAVCVSFIDVFRQRGFKVTGQAVIIGPDDTDFSIVGARLLQMGAMIFPSAILSPSRWRRFPVSWRQAIGFSRIEPKARGWLAPIKPMVSSPSDPARLADLSARLDPASVLMFGK